MVYFSILKLYSDNYLAELGFKINFSTYDLADFQFI